MQGADRQEAARPDDWPHERGAAKTLGMWRAVLPRLAATSKAMHAKFSPSCRTWRMAPASGTPHAACRKRKQPRRLATRRVDRASTQLRGNCANTPRETGAIHRIQIEARHIVRLWISDGKANNPPGLRDSKIMVLCTGAATRQDSNVPPIALWNCQPFAIDVAR